MDLIVSLSNVTLAQEIPFGILQLVQCILYGTPVSFASHSSLLTAKCVNLVMASILQRKLTIFFIMATVITDVLFKQVLICTAVKWVDNDVQ